MSEANREEERRRCREFYEKWDFIQRIVELYAEGVSWKGCRLIALPEPESIPTEYRQVIADNDIKNGVRNMLVDGIGDFKLKLKDSTHVLSIPMMKESFLEEAEPPGRSYLWAAARNAKHLEDMAGLLGVAPGAGEMVNLLVNDMCAVLGVPHWLLLPNATNANPAAIKWGLIVYRGRVDQLRNYIAFEIQEPLKALIFQASGYNGYIEIAWNEDWLPHDRAYGPVYQVFKAQGIELRSLREEALNAAKMGLDNHFISRQTYDERVKWFI